MLRLFFTVAFCLTSRAYGSRCYSDVCHNRTTELETGPLCLVSSIQRGKDCVNLRFTNLGLAQGSVDESLGRFRLSAYVKDFGQFNGRTTAFNLTVGEPRFRRLITRYQDLADDRRAACREIELRGAGEEVPFPELFVSCPFADETFEATPYRLEYMAIGENFEYSRRLVFVVPRHATLDEDRNDVTTQVLFFYIDVSNTAILRLHLQPLPAKFNVTRYRVWLINNDTNVVVRSDINLREDDDEIRHNLSVDEGVHCIKVAAMHPLCGEYGCVNGTSPIISTKQPVRRLLIMIISVVWIPPVIMYALYQSYKLYKKKMYEKRRKPVINCLLVYSPTHRAHVDVVKKFALYVRSCGINAMIDILDIPDTPNKDPGLWCNEAFEKADVIVVASSPPAIPADGFLVPSPVNVYRNVDDHALRLLKENYSRRNKRYFAISFPYCRNFDLPEEARLFRRFEMPRDLNKLVRNIYAVDRVRFFGTSSEEFSQAIEIAVAEIARDECTRRDILRETVTAEHAMHQDPSDAAVPLETTSRQDIMNSRKKSNGGTKNVTHTDERYFTTNIDELNLLGVNGVKGETFIYRMPGALADDDDNDNDDDNNEFRIDRLNL